MVGISEVKVRNMLETDIKYISSIQEGCYSNIVHESAQSLLAKLHASPRTCFVACSIGAGDYGDVVGYLLSVPWLRLEPPSLDAPTCVLPKVPDCLYLHDMAVSVEYQYATSKTRVAPHLFNAFHSAFEASGLRCASLVAIENMARYWQKYGFMAVQGDSALQHKLAPYGEQARYMELFQR